MPDIVPVIGARRYQYFEKETGTGAEWGTRPTTPVIVHAPTTGYGVKLARTTQQNNPYIGSGQRRHAQNQNSLVSGQITMPLYGAHDSGVSMSLAQYFMSLAISSTADDNEILDPRPSFRAFDIQRDGAGTVVAGHEDTGLRVNKMTLRGSQAGVILTLDVIGRTQVNLTSSAEAVPDDREKLLEFLFSDTTLSLGGTAINYDEFSWEIDWGLKPLFLNSNRPLALAGQHCVQTLTVKPLKTANTYDAYLRTQAQTEVAAVLTAKGLHNGTSTNNYSKFTATFSRASLLDGDDTISPDDFGMQPLKFALLKPDTTDGIVTIAWNTVA